jgi:uncharacterized membrane-anchored protein YitT (DUF2179 family)
MKNEKITSRFQKARNYKKKWVTIKAESKSIILIMIGIISASFGLKGFLLPNNFIDGGITGLSLLLTETTQMPLSILIIIVNIPFIILGYITLGKQFAIKTSFAIIGLGLCIAFINFPNITNDKLLVAVFGGIFLGAGIGFSIRGGAVIDGTEVLAIYLSKKWGVTIGDFIIIINIFIFGTAAIVLSIEAALYSMITYFSASKTLDFIVDGFDEYIGVTIVSSHCKEIKEMIVETMGRGVTVYNGTKGIGKRGERSDIDIIYTVITRLELNKLNIEIEKITPTAFVVMNTVKDTKGGMIKKKITNFD